MIKYQKYKKNRICKNRRAICKLKSPCKSTSSKRCSTGWNHFFVKSTSKYFIMGKDECGLLTAILHPSFSLHLSLLLCFLLSLPFLSSSLPSSSIQCTRAYMNCVSAQFRGCRLALQYQLSRKLYSERVFTCVYV